MAKNDTRTTKILIAVPGIPALGAAAFLLTSDFNLFKESLWRKYDFQKIPATAQKELTEGKDKRLEKFFSCDILCSVYPYFDYPSPAFGNHFLIVEMPDGEFKKVSFNGREISENISKSKYLNNTKDQKGSILIQKTARVKAGTMTVYWEGD